MSDFEFTSNEMEKFLSDLNPSKASRPDLLPTRILKLVASEIAPVFSVIFQQSYDTGRVLDIVSKSDHFSFSFRCYPLLSREDST
jgi:hypothetical protein